MSFLVPSWMTLLSLDDSSQRLLGVLISQLGSATPPEELHSPCRQTHQKDLVWESS